MIARRTGGAVSGGGQSGPGRRDRSGCDLTGGGARPGRRAVVAGLALWPFAAPAGPLRRVLFVGNSFLHEHDVPGRVAARAAAAGRPIEVHRILRNGATLDGHLRRETVRETLGWGWEAVVLQDHSTTALHADRAAAGAHAVALARRLAPEAAILLVEPWARAEGHRLYDRPAGPGYAAPRTPREMTRLNAEHGAAIARATGASVAGVACAWLAATEAGRRLHAPDGYHANAAGAALVASTVWRALAPLLP